MPGPTDLGRGGPTVVEQPQAPVAEEQVVCVEGTELKLVLEGNCMQQENIVVEGKDGSEGPFPQIGEEVPYWAPTHQTEEMGRTIPTYLRQQYFTAA